MSLERFQGIAHPVVFHANTLLLEPGPRHRVDAAAQKRLNAQVKEPAPALGQRKTGKADLPGCTDFAALCLDEQCRKRRGKVRRNPIIK